MHNKKFGYGYVAVETHNTFIFSARPECSSCKRCLCPCSSSGSVSVRLTPIDHQSRSRSRSPISTLRSWRRTSHTRTPTVMAFSARPTTTPLHIYSSTRFIWLDMTQRFCWRRKPQG